MMFGAGGAHAVANPTPDAFHATLSTDDKAMLALRTDERRNIMLEEARIEGPGIEENNPPMAPAPAIQLGSFNAGEWNDEEELAAWYAHWRLPSLMDLPGCVRVRKLVSVAGWAKHAVMYEFESMEMRLKHFEEPHESLSLDKTHWSSQITGNTVHTPGSPTIGPRIWPL